MLFPPKEFRQLFRVDFPYPRLRERCSALQGAPCKGFPGDCMAAELTWERGRPARMRALRPAFLGAAGNGPNDPYPGMDLPRRSEQVERCLSVLADVQRLVPEEGGAGA